MKNIRKAKGFTLIELIVVVVIIGILATIGIAGYNSITEKANVNADNADARTIVSVLSADTAVESFGTVAAYLDANTADALDFADEFAGTLTYEGTPAVLEYEGRTGTYEFDVSGAVVEIAVNPNTP